MTENTSIKKILEGKVASILNERELVINIGADQGVKDGMKFKVLTEKPTTIIDPDTGVDLGELDREKVRVQALEVKAKFSVCRTYQKKFISGSSLYGFISASLVNAEPRTVPETLRVDDSSLPAPLSEEESFVKKGDRVVQLINDD